MLVGYLSNQQDLTHKLKGTTLKTCVSDFPLRREFLHRAAWEVFFPWICFTKFNNLGNQMVLHLWFKGAWLLFALAADIGVAHMMVVCSNANDGVMGS